MRLARKLRMGGEVSALVIPQRGFYADGWPSGVPVRCRVRSRWLELCLRARLGLKGLWRGLRGTGVIGVGRVYASIIRANGGVEHVGLLSTKLITDAGVALLVSDWNDSSTDLSNFNFHGCGTGTTAEAASQTALVTESTTALNPDSTRATGTKSKPSANILRSVGTVTFDATAAITEHGLFSQAATGGGTLWDRSLFSALNVASGDSIQFTYEATMSSGG